MILKNKQHSVPGIFAEGSGVSDGGAGCVDREEFFGGFFCHPLYKKLPKKIYLSAYLSFCSLKVAWLTLLSPRGPERHYGL